MTRRLLNLFAMAALCVCLAGCGGKNSVDASIDKIEKAIAEVEKNKKNMTEADWKALNTELEGPVKVLKEAFDSKETGAMKKIKITTTLFKFAAVASEAGLNTALENINQKVEDAKKEASQ
jgi:hypothetical protein